MKLARKITLLFLVPFLTLLVVLGYRGVHREVANYEAQIVIDLQVTGRAIGPVFAEVWRAEGDVRALALLTTMDAALAPTSVRWIAREAQGAGAESPEREHTEIVPGADGVKRAVMSLPVATAGLPPGRLEFTRPLRREAEIFDRAVRDHTLTTLAALAAASLVATFVGVSFIGRPIGTLTAQARRIGEGDLTHRLVLPRKDEIADLAHEMDAMADRLVEARGRIVEEAEARIRTLEQLRHADRLGTVGKLAAGLAHELGTPLNVVSGRAKMIATRPLAPEAIQENATIIAGQAERMTKIIRQLLDFARRGQSKRAKLDAAALCGSLISLLEPLAKKRSVTLRVDGGLEPEIVEADAGQIEQVLTNLIVNGIDATDGGGEVTVSLREEDATPPDGEGCQRGRFVRIDVRDHGHGIKPEDRERIFEPFFTTKDVGEGTGLGLSVAHGIVHDNGGWIAVESEVGKGSCFSVYLPHGGAA